MHVLHVVNSLVLGGAQQMLVKLVNELAGSEVESTVLSLRAGPLLDQIDQAHVKVVDLGIPKNRSLRRITRAIAAALEEQQPDIVQSWMYASNLACSLAGTHRTCPLVWNIRHSVSSLRHERPGTMASILASIPLSHTASSIIYNARVSARQHERLGYGRARTLVLPNGFDTKRFSTSATLRASAREALGLTDCVGPILGHVGRWHPQKDHRTLLSAFRQLRSHCPDARLLLCGPDVVAENAALKTLLGDYEIEDCVALLGARDRTEIVYRALDLFVLSSSYGEAFPNVLGEAMATEVPCVATDVGDSADILEGLGQVVAPRDDHALAAAMLKQLQLGDDERSALVRAGRTKIEQNYAITRIARDYADHYAEVRSRSAMVN